MLISFFFIAITFSEKYHLLEIIHYEITGLTAVVKYIYTTENMTR